MHLLVLLQGQCKPWKVKISIFPGVEFSWTIVKNFTFLILTLAEVRICCVARNYCCMHKVL